MFLFLAVLITTSLWESVATICNISTCDQKVQQWRHVPLRNVAYTRDGYILVRDGYKKLSQMSSNYVIVGSVVVCHITMHLIMLTV